MGRVHRFPRGVNKAIAVSVWLKNSFFVLQQKSLRKSVKILMSFVRGKIYYVNSRKNRLSQIYKCKNQRLLKVLIQFLKPKGTLNSSCETSLKTHGINFGENVPNNTFTTVRTRKYICRESGSRLRLPTLLKYSVA
jgi:hypothetical protein